MITQAIKRWFQKLFAWWPRYTSQSVSYAPVDNRANAASSPENATYASMSNPTPQPGVSPLIAENTQGEVTCSTIEEPPEQVPPQPTVESSHLFPPATSPSALVEYTPAAPPRKNDASTAQAEPAASQPTPEQRLDFLHYLVQRGLVNEGFSEGQSPDQNRRES